MTSRCIIILLLSSIASFAQIGGVAGLGILNRAVPPATITNTLIAKWNFTEGSGTSAADSSGNGHTLTLVNTPTWTTYGSAGAIQFDSGSSESASVAIDLSTITNKLTLSFWLYWDVYAADFDMFLEFTPSMNDYGGAFWVLPNTGGGISIKQNRPSDSGGNDFNFTEPSAATWHHYAIIFNRAVADSSIGGEVWVDSVPQTLNAGTLFGQNGEGFANSTLYFFSRAGSALFGAGRMADFRVYRDAISGRSVTNLFNTGAQ